MWPPAVAARRWSAAERTEKLAKEVFLGAVLASWRTRRRSTTGCCTNKV
jgi:hypothetical protein